MVPSMAVRGLHFRRPKKPITRLARQSVEQMTVKQRKCKMRKDMLDELEKAKPDAWIRFSIVTSMPHERGMLHPPRPVFKGDVHHLLLEKLGFEHKGGALGALAMVGNFVGNFVGTIVSELLSQKT
jgi:hypothetical protein